MRQSFKVGFSVAKDEEGSRHEKNHDKKMTEPSGPFNFNPDLQVFVSTFQTEAKND